MEEFDQFIEEILSQKYPKTKWYLERMDDYYLAMSITAIAKLRLPDHDLKMLKENIPYTEDRLLSFILGDTTALNYEKNIHNLDPYIYLHNFIVDHTRTYANIDSFLKHFYTAFKGGKWHNSHLDKHAHFFGYWSFGLAALVSRLEIDDVEFLDHMFYPRDLIGQEFMPTWEDSERGVLARTQKEKIQSNLAANRKFGNNYDELLNQEIINQFKNVWKDKNNIIFSKDFSDEINRISNGGKTKDKYQNPENLKSLLREMAHEIKDIKVANHHFYDLFKDEKVRTEIEKNLRMKFEAEDFEIEAALMDFFIKDKVGIEEQNLINQYQNIADKILDLDAKYDANDEVYWDEIDHIINEDRDEEEEQIQMVKDVNDALRKRLDKKTNMKNFNISLDDFL